MVVKILSSASANFNGVRYNDNKIKNEKGELMAMNNFPSFINRESSQQEVRDYLKSISKNEKIKKPQFHAVISTKFQEHTKEELTKLAEDFMQEMGYGKQPYVVVFHNDTENNHVHIVSTRVNKETGKKINDSFEKLKSQRALNHVMEKNYGINYDNRLKSLLEYQFSNYRQLELLLERNGFKAISDSDNDVINIYRNGVAHKTLYSNKIPYSAEKTKDKRSYQIKALLNKYKALYSCKVFKVVDNREAKGLYNESKNEKDELSYESEIQQKLREVFGIDIIFHFKDDNRPFGYTLIDNVSQKIYKGSDIIKMQDLFEFTDSSIEKDKFERYKEYNLRTDLEKKILLNFLNRKGEDVSDFQLFENKNFKKKDREFQQLKEETKEYINKGEKSDFISIIKNEDGKHYVLHERYHQIHELEAVIGYNAYQKYKENTKQNQNTHANIDSSEDLIKTAEDIFKQLSKSAYTTKDNTEENLKRGKRKKRR